MSKTITLGVLLSGGGRTLMNILDEIDVGKLDAKVGVVVASRECKGIERCRNRGLDVKLVEYKKFGPDKLEEYSAEIAKNLDSAGCDLVILAGFLSRFIIPERYAGKVMNIHPALLPSFGGKGFYGHHVHEAVVASGAKISGCTVHFVTNEYDAGPIVIQRTTPVCDTDTADDIAENVFQQECIAYPEAIKLFAEGKLTIDGQIVRIEK